MTSGYARQLFRLGRWDEAERQARIALDGAVSGVSLWNPLLDLAYIRAAQGDFAQAHALVDRARTVAKGSPDPQYMTASTEVESSLALFERAPREALAVVRRGLVVLEPLDDPDAMPSLALGLRAAADDPDSGLGDVDRFWRVAQRIGEAAKVRSTPTAVPLAGLLLAEAERSRALGTPDPSAWEAAIEVLERQGAAHERAYALTRLAEAIMAAAPRDARAERLLDEAESVARSLGAVPLEGLIAEVREGIPLAMGRP
jgi:hypothetical protein